MRVPLCELHVHAEGTLQPAHALALALERGIDTGGLIADGRYVWHDFTSFLAAYDRAAALLTRVEDYTKLALDYLTQLAGMGTIHAELFASPDHARASGLDPEAYLAALGEGCRTAKAATGIEARLIVVGVRHFGLESVLAAARIAASTGEGLVTGFGMAGDERAGSLADFRPAFCLADEAGLGTTVHAGEFGGPQAVQEAIDTLPVSRIGHGVASARDPRLMQTLARRGIVLEICPSSNVALGLYPGLRDHPLRVLMESGVRVTLSTDDPAFFDTTLAAEHERAASAFGLDAAALSAFTRTGLEAAFIDAPTRARLLAQLAMPRHDGRN